MRVDPSAAGHKAPGGARALALLGWLRLRGTARMRGRQLATWRGSLSLAAVALAVAFIAHTLQASAPPDVLSRAVSDESLLALGLLVGCLLTVVTSTGPALHFGAAEMDILWSAPLERGTIVLYKIALYASGAALSAALFALLLPSAAVGRGQLFVATLATLTFVQLASAALSGLALLARRRRPGLPTRAIALLLALGVTLVPLLLAGELSVEPLRATFAESAPARVALAPFALVAGLYLPAPSGIALASRMLLVALTLAALVACVVGLDRYVSEERAEASRTAQRRWQRILASGSPWRRATGAIRSRRAPPRVGGIAPIVWAQGLGLVRTGAPMIGALFAFAAFGGAALGAFGETFGASRIGAALVFAFLFLLPKLLIHDFRGHPERIELLKALPVTPFAVCVAQVAVPFLVALGLQWTLLAAALTFADAHARVPLVALGVLLMPLTALHYTIENLLFLLAPVRMIPVGRLDFDFLGRTLLEFVVKCTLLGLAAVPVVTVGIAVLRLFPDGLPLAFVSALAVLWLEAALALGTLALRYARIESAGHAFG